MDLVRLAIVYETSRAAASLQQLDSQLAAVQSRTDAVNRATTSNVAVVNVSTRAMKNAGQGALILAQSLTTGGLSASAMASSLGRVANVVFGPWGIAIAFAIGVLTLFINNNKKALEQSRKFGDQLRDVQRSVDRLLSPTEQSPFAAEIQRISDLIVALDRQVEDMQNSWLRRAQEFLSIVGLVIPGFGTFKPPAPGPIKEAGQSAALKKELGKLTPATETEVAVNRYNQAIEEQGRILNAINAGPVKEFEEGLQLAQTLLGNLGKIEGPEAAATFRSVAASIVTATEGLRKLERQIALFERGLFTISDALEEFVITGTFAFTEFLNNILRLLYRDFSSDLIHSLIRGAFPMAGGGNIETKPLEVLGNPGGGGPSGSIHTNVSFNINAIDAQGVAQFIQNNGSQIAAEVTAQAGRSSNMRSRLRR